jgi:hypothetical protein
MRCRPLMLVVAIAMPLAAAGGLGATSLAQAAGPRPHAAPAKRPARHATAVKLFGDRTVEKRVDRKRAGVAEAFPFVSKTSARATSMSVYVDRRDSASTVVAGLYANHRGHPGALLAHASLSRLAKGRWNVVRFRATPIKRSHTYWVAVLGRHGMLAFRDRRNGGCHSKTAAHTGLKSLPAMWRTGATRANCPISAFVSRKRGKAGGPSTGSPTPGPVSTPTPVPTPAPGSALDPSLPGPPPPLAACTQSVSSASALTSALQHAAAGAVLCLASGSYGRITVNNSSRTAYATVQPAPGASVTLAGISLQDSSYLRFQALTFVQTMATSVVQSNHIQFLVDDVSGQGFMIRATQESLWQDDVVHDITRTPGAAAPDGYGFWLNSYSCCNVNAFNSTDGLDGDIFVGNTLNHIPQDGMQFGGGQLHHTENITIAANTFENIAAASCCTSTDHSDSIQIIGGTSITVEDNYFHDVQDACMFKDDTLTNLVYENNLALDSPGVPGGAGILCQIWDAQNAKIINNTFWRVSGAGLTGFMLRSSGGVSGLSADVENNVLAAGSYQYEPGYHVTEAANYVGANPGWDANYIPLSGSPLIGKATAAAPAGDRVGVQRTAPADIGAMEHQ